MNAIEEPMTPEQERIREKLMSEFLTNHQRISTSVVDVHASGPVDGMNELHPDGSYIRLRVGADDVRVSLGAAEVLAYEILGIINK